MIYILMTTDSNIMDIGVLNHLDKMTLHTAIITFLILRFIGGVVGEPACNPLMQSLVKQADKTGQYGSWDACCAKIGNDCYLTQVTAPPGYEPCDAAHSERGGCNRTPEGTVCMIGSDSYFSNAPCGTSHIRVCDTILFLAGATAPFDLFANLSLTPAEVLSRGTLGTQLCCSTSSCQINSTCTLPYSMNCLTDGYNIICVPFDQPNAQTYAASVTHGCASTSSVPPNAVASHAISYVVPNGVPSHISNTGVIVGVIVIGIAIWLAVIFIFLVKRRRAQSRSGVNETPPVEEANFSAHPVSVPFQSMQGFVHPPGEFTLFFSTSSPILNPNSTIRSRSTNEPRGSA
jgi:hypothetical protein